MQKSTLNRRTVLQLLAAAMAAPNLVYANQPELEPPTPVLDVSQAPIPVYIPAGTGKKGKIGNGDIIFKLNKSQTSGLLGSTESILLPGHLGAPPHSHKGFDEICRVIEGTLSIMVGDEVYQVSAGDWHLRPRGVVHTFWNTGQIPARFIELYTPGGHEAYMNELADMFINNARPKPGDLDKLAMKYDIAFDWPKLQQIITAYKVYL